MIKFPGSIKNFWVDCNLHFPLIDQASIPVLPETVLFLQKAVEGRVRNDGVFLVIVDIGGGGVDKIGGRVVFEIFPQGFPGFGNGVLPGIKVGFV